MRALILVAIVAAAGVALSAQTTVRTARPTRPDGAVSHQPVRGISPLPPPGVTPGPRSAGGSPVSDPRLGAGGVRGRTGNIVYPGTPAGGTPGSVSTPGIPSQPRPVPRPPRGRRPGSHGPAVPVYVPVYGLYGYAASPNVIEVNAETLARSNAEHVIEVDEEGVAERPAEEPAAPDYWLIALRGGLIYAATEFGVEHRALWFVTMQGDEYVVPLAEVDAEFCRRLNAERGYEIDLDLP